MEMLIGMACLAAPMLMAGILVLATERDDGQTRLVIVGGRIRRRRTLERK
jgi:hypothetical protein